MTFCKMLAATALVVTGLTLPALAQDAAQDTEFRMPEVCTPAAAQDGMHDGHDPEAPMDHAAHASDAEDADASGMPEHVRENMSRMNITMPAMQQGMMQADADVAFACGMIAHHQGAIDMAQVLLEHGDDPEMIELAGEIIAAQVGEIEQMTNWLAENAK